MAAKYKSYLSKEISSGKVELPDELGFLSNAKYLAVSEKRVNGERGWYVEIQSVVLKSMIDAKKKLNATRLSDRNARAENQRLLEENADLQKRADQMRGENKRLRANAKPTASALKESNVEIKSLKAKLIKVEKELAIHKELYEQQERNFQRIEANREQDSNLTNRREEIQALRQNGQLRTFFDKVEEGTKMRGLAILAGDAGSTKK